MIDSFIKLTATTVAQAVEGGTNHEKIMNLIPRISLDKIIACNASHFG